MAETQFVSTYKGINYKVSDANKHAKFNDGKLVTSDPQVADYLRQHPDFGVTLTEVANPAGKSVVVPELHFCKHPGCDFVGKTENALRGHMKVHANNKNDAGAGQAAETGGDPGGTGSKNGNKEDES